jgi:hypothetical protein
MIKLELSRNEMAFRKRYEQTVFDGTLTTVFRPGNRMFPNWRGYKKGEQITARIIKKVGNDAKLISPVFTKNKKQVKIKNIEVININNLNKKDFIYSCPNVKTIDDLKKQFVWVYNKKPEEYNNIVTKIQLEYV